MFTLVASVDQHGGMIDVRGCGFDSRSFHFHVTTFGTGQGRRSAAEALFPSKRNRLRLARFPSKRNARNASDCVWMETGLEKVAAGNGSYTAGFTSKTGWSLAG